MWTTQSGFKYLPKKSLVPISPSIDSIALQFSPASRVKTTDTLDKKTQKFATRLHLKVVEEKAMRYNSTSIISQLHDPIVNAIKRMPKSVINYLNINHYQSELEQSRKKGVAKLEQELEYELIQSLQLIEDEVIKKLFETQLYSMKKDSIAKRFSSTDRDFNVKVNFNINMVTYVIENMNECIHKIINLLYIERPKMAVSMENIWKLLVFIIDNLLQYTYDQNNNYIKEITADIQNQLEMQTKNVRALEEKVFFLQKQHEDEINKERQRYYQLQEQFEKLTSNYLDIQRLRDEDVKTVANGGVYFLKKNLIQLDEALKSFSGQVQTRTQEMQVGLRKVASTMIYKNKQNESVIPRIRSILGIDILKQPCGDIALGHVYSEHPWMAILELKNLIKSHFKFQEEFGETKLSLFHRIMSSPILEKTSACHHFLQMFEEQNFHYLIKCLLTLINPVNEQTHLTVQINAMIGRIFNLFGMEGLELIDLNKLKEFYANTIEYFTMMQYNIKMSETPLERPESSNTMRRIIMMNLSQPSSFLTFKFNKKQYDIIIVSLMTKSFTEEEINEMNECVYKKLEEKKELIYSAVLYEFFEYFAKQSLRNFQKKVRILQNKLQLMTNQEDFIKKSVANEIADSIFHRYNGLDKIKIWHYLIWRYYIVFEKQLKYDSTLTDIDQLIVIEFRQSIFGQVSIDSVIEQFMIDTLQRIRAMLIFNPLSFLMIDNKSIRCVNEMSIEGSQTSLEVPTQKLVKQLSKKQASDIQDNFE